jgi:hypothetical protein
MTDTETEILSAFCDGEVVDPIAFAAALADPRGRDALVDFARLRAAVASVRPMPASLGQLRRSPSGARHRLWRWPALPAAAAIVLFLLATAWLLPVNWLARSRKADSPPSPSRVVRYEPGVDWHPEEGR